MLFLSQIIGWILFLSCFRSSMCHCENMYTRTHTSTQKMITGLIIERNILSRLNYALQSESNIRKFWFVIICPCHECTSYYFYLFSLSIFNYSYCKMSTSNKQQWWGKQFLVLQICLLTSLLCCVLMYSDTLCVKHFYVKYIGYKMPTQPCPNPAFCKIKKTKRPK